MHYSTKEGDVSAVEDVTFTLHSGEAIGLVGESGCGKTSVALTLLRLLPDNSLIKEGDVKLDDGVPESDELLESRVPDWRPDPGSPSPALA